ncbi:Maf family protein [Alistipes sp.]|uniref:Maf family protein n=1 Tax=Alistipes sp. TaxID=1872444 RepID=UPI0025BEC448|nr:Maf family protein [Alistipes sp.]
MLLNDKLKPYRLLLASQSPRRRELMTGCGLPYVPAEKFDCEETYPDDLPLIAVSEYLSTLKSKAYPVPLRENDILLTADTVVVANGEFRETPEGQRWHGGEILGKPRDRDDARRMLKILSGARHLVTTGVTLRSATRMTRFTSQTQVWFRILSDEEIDHYIDTFQPFDKAGAYGIQEWIGYAAIERIEGSFYNVMGLPIQKVYTELDKFLNP